MPRPLPVLIALSLSACTPPPDSVVPESFTSTLPIVEVDTDGARILDEPKIPARFRLIGESERSGSMRLEALAGIEIRGRSSQKNFPKSQYDVEFRTGGQGPLAVPVLGMPRHSDWILYGPYADKSLLRNQLTYSLSRDMGRYAVRGRFVELFLNEGAAADDPYRGVYLLSEKIGPGRERVNVSRESGFILKIDALDPADDRYVVTERGLRIIVVYPRAENLTDSHESFLKVFFDQFERSLFSEEWHGYRRLLDVDAFVDYLILAELSKNIDAFRTSTYMHLEGDGPLVMGPVWDYNQAYGNSGYHPRSVRTDGWRASLSDTTGWLDALRRDVVFTERFKTRWNEARHAALSDEAILERIDATAQRLQRPASRNFGRWPILGKHVLGNARPVPRTYRAEIRELRKWVLARAAWIDAHVDEFHDHD